MAVATIEKVKVFQRSDYEDVVSVWFRTAEGQLRVRMTRAPRGRHGHLIAYVAEHGHFPPEDETPVDPTVELPF